MLTIVNIIGFSIILYETRIVIKLKVAAMKISFLETQPKFLLQVNAKYTSMYTRRIKKISIIHKAKYFATQLRAYHAEVPAFPHKN